MSKSRKNIQHTLFEEFPEPNENQNIVRVVSTRGTNQIEVEYPITKEKILVILPTKFNKLIWIKKGDYVIISTDRTEQNKGKIKGFVDHVLLTHHIKHLKQQGLWPFEEQDAKEEEEETEEIDEMEGNPNRMNFSDDEEDDEDEEED